MKTSRKSCAFPAVISVLIFVFSLPSFSATTGKITGTVTDMETNEPLPGVNVIIEGATLGAATNLAGQYTILNIPPGIYTLKATMIGYKALVYENIRVKTDLTTRRDFKLTQTVLDAGEEIRVVAERPIVQMDMTSSLAAVSAEEIEALPVQEIDQVIRLQAGVVSQGGNLHIRGGRGRETAYWIDGVPVTNLNGSRGIAVENYAIQEMQLVSGTFNAEYGKAMSGIVKITTKEGGSKYSGRLSGFAGDFISGSHVYEVLDRVEVVTDPRTGKSKKVGYGHNPLEKWNPEYDANFSLSGPVPLSGKKLTFFLNGRYNESVGYMYGRKWFTAQGLPGDSSLVPLDPRRRYSWQTKLTWRPSGNIKLNYNLLLRGNRAERNANRNLRYVPDAGTQNYSNGQVHMLTLSHTLSPKSFYEFKLGRYLTDGESYLYKDPYRSPGYLIKVTKSDGSVDYVDYGSDAEKEEIINQVNENENWRYEYVIDPANPIGYLHPDSNAISRAPKSFEDLRTSLGHGYSQDSYWLAKFDFTSQMHQNHQVQAGFELVLHQYDRENFNLRPDVDEAGNEIEPFVPSIEPISTVFHNDYSRKPREFSVYVQDKMEFQNIFIMNLGLRFDYFDANHVVPTDPADPDIYRPYPYGGYVYHTGPDSIPTTLGERRSLMHTRVEPKTQLSPRVGISYPITDKGVIHFSYGHFFQMPQASYLYARPDFKLAVGDDDMLFGNADLNVEKTVQYEIGLQQQIGVDLGLDVTLFYKDIRDWVGISPVIETRYPDTRYRKYENKDYANVRGITIDLEKRFTNNYAATLDYTFSIAEGTYSSPGDAFSAITSGKEPAKKLIYMDYDRRHLLNGTFSFRAAGWLISLIGRFRTGFPYTPNLMAGSAAASYIGWDENIARRPPTSSLDLYLDKKLVKTGPLSHRIYVRVYNLLDQKGATNVYSDTGTPDFDTYTTHRLYPYDADRVGSLEHFLLQPGWYQSPRQIQLGYTIEF